ncbi:hypothetical protein [Enterocloster lavalensis]|uniref:hypothetical protein n=1 Tax=Enterocloster lavalensis TaxID=460384 RepID=UPI002FDB698E
MKDLVETIQEYWVQEVMTVITGALAWLARKVQKWKQEQDLVKQGVLAILHDRLYQACQFYLKRGYCTIDDRDNLEYMFRPYKALGGNGTGEELYNRCLALPYGPESGETE